MTTKLANHSIQHWMPFTGKQLYVHPLPQEHYSNEPYYLQLLRYFLQQKPVHPQNSSLSKIIHFIINPKKISGLPRGIAMSTLDVRAHAFNVGIAKDHSPSIALFIGHLAYWAEKNLSNNKNIHDGLVWSFDTLDALCDQFPYFTRRQIETMIKNSVEAGLVAKGNYNQTQYDRTCWYALTPAAYDYLPHLSSEKYINRLFLSISQNGEMEFAEWGNRFTHFVMTIPDTDPDPENTTTTTAEQPATITDPPPKTDSLSSSSVFNKEIDKELLELRKKHLSNEDRDSELFLKQCKWHVDFGSKDHTFNQRIAGLKKIIRSGCFDAPSTYPKNKESKQRDEQLLWSSYQSYVKSPIEIGLRERGIAKLETFEIWKTKNA